MYKSPANLLASQSSNTDLRILCYIIYALSQDQNLNIAALDVDSLFTKLPLD